MNNELLDLLKKIVADHGESVLGEPRRVSAFFADLAREIPKPQKNAFLKCLEHGFAQVLKNSSEAERVSCKQRLVKKLHDEEGLALDLCAATLDLLERLLFGEAQKKIFCCNENCKKELQEGWQSCPFCVTPTAQPAAPVPPEPEPPPAKSVPLVEPAVQSSTTQTTAKPADVPKKKTSKILLFWKILGAIIGGWVGFYILGPWGLLGAVAVWEFIGWLAGLFGKKNK